MALVANDFHGTIIVTVVGFPSFAAYSEILRHSNVFNKKDCSSISKQLQGVENSELKAKTKVFLK